MFSKWLLRVPHVKAQEAAEEEDLVDPQEVLREKCKEKKEVQKFRDILDTCNNRVRSRKHTEETCLEEVIDYMHALDHCVCHEMNLFSKLK